MTRNMALIVTGVMIIFSTPLWAVGVEETFDKGPGGFLEDESFSVSNGRFLFQGDRSTGSIGKIWVGGTNSAGWNPNPNHSNYFKDFDVSMEVTWESGNDEAPYGLSVCIQKNSLGSPDSISFVIDGAGNNGAYKIVRVQEGESTSLVDWTASSHILPNQANKLSIFKIGNYFSFSINGNRVQRLTNLEGCAGGAIALESSKSVDVAFDNFRVIPLIDEDFNSDAGGFSGSNFFYVSNKQLIFRGDASTGARSVPWDGGANPGGLSPEPTDSNYFEEFGLSVDAIWQGGNAEAGYGVSVCNQKNSAGTVDYVLFLIDGQGDKMGYYISRVFNGQHKILVDWTPSSLIKSGESNNLSILKLDNRFVFSINQSQIQELTLEDCGGSINLEASRAVDVSFDNFFIFDMSSSSDGGVTPEPENQAPTASFTVSPESGDAPLTVDLDAGNSRDEGMITGYAWSSSDGQRASGEKTSLTFNTAGTYTITLTVTDDKGKTSTAQKTVVVKAAPCTYQITPTSHTHNANADTGHVTVIPSASNCSWSARRKTSWVSLTGITSGKGQGTVNYAIEENETCELNRKGEVSIAGQTFTISQLAPVNCPPIPRFSALPQGGQMITDNPRIPPNLTVKVDARLSQDQGGIISHYAWSTFDQDDKQQTASGGTASFKFTKEGTYEITLTVTDDQGASEQLTKKITVYPPTTRLVNLSTRAKINGGAGDIIAGFMLTGTGTQQVMLRGSSLEQGVNPAILLQRLNGGEIARNDDWQSDFRHSEITAHMAGKNASDAALVRDLSAGNYTVTLSSNATKGLGIVEVVTLNPLGKTQQPIKLFNLSTRAQIEGGAYDIIAGFIIEGEGVQKVVVRGTGVEAGVDPILILRELGQDEVMAQNDSWQADPLASLIPAHLQLGLKPSDAALLLYLPKGAYTVILSSMGTQKLGLIEVFAVD